MYSAPPPLRRPPALWAGLLLCVAGALLALWGVALPWVRYVGRDASGVIVQTRIHGYRFPIGWLVVGWALFMLRISYLAYRDVRAQARWLAALVSISNMLCILGLMGACAALDLYGGSGQYVIFGGSLLLAGGVALLARAAGAE